MCKYLLIAMLIREICFLTQLIRRKHLHQSNLMINTNSFCPQILVLQLETIWDCNNNITLMIMYNFANLSYPLECFA